MTERPDDMSGRHRGTDDTTTTEDLARSDDTRTGDATTYDDPSYDDALRSSDATGSDDATRSGDATQAGEATRSGEAARAGEGTGSSEGVEPLVSQADAVDLKTRWEVIQQGFVDDPRNAVSDADSLVDEVLEKLSAMFDEQQRDLESQWSDGEPSTEDLRGALQRYRAFFERLLTI
jgi:hypothetical protein